jgi:hypothetical protein
VPETEGTGGWTEVHNEELRSLCPSPNSVGVIR